MSTSPRSSTDRRLRVAAGAVLALLLAAPTAAAAVEVPAADAEALRRQAREILGQPRFQPSVRVEEGPLVDAPPAEAPAAARPLRPAGERRRALPPSTAGVELGRVTFYLLLGAGLAVLLAAAFRRLAARRRHAGPPAAADEALAAQAPPDGGAIAFEEAERLAAAGRYGEAVHALLLAAVARVSAAAPRPPGAAATSRELVALLPLGGDARTAFAALVRQVEQSLFGGAAVSAAGWSAGREQFRRIVGAGG